MGARVILFAGLIWMTLAGSCLLAAQPEASADTQSAVKFTFERVGLPVPKYGLAIDANGAGTYQADEGTEPFDRTFVLSSATTAKIFALLRGVRLEPSVCASKAKNVADTGAKTLTYTADGTMTSCAYNYSENKDVEQLTTTLQAIAETMDEGRTLERLHRFDRLGLDAEMIAFSQEVSAGRALDLGTIATCLRSIADDAEVIQRVRTRAEKLLATVPVEVAPQ
jgi:hypothetical protein